MTKPTTKKRRKALSPESREQQLINYAVDLAEQQLLDGTASSQVITHFLKLGTAKAELEKEKLRKENQLMEAKTKQIKSADETRTLVENAIKAMKRYSGSVEYDEYDY